MEIIKLSPVFKQYIWGGDNIKKIYGKDTPCPPVAESWEISAHPDGLSVAINGIYRGMTIPEIVKKYGSEFYGDSMKEGEEFPLLLKILDAEDNLSVQVHPDDEYAYKNENGGKGKTEAWYILSANEGAELIYGFNKDVTKEEFAASINEGKLDEILNRVPCKAGDVFYIPAGTVHAVGKGMMIAEIQQSSNTTYRVYDYNRRDKNGNLRELHIEKAIDVSDLKSSKNKEKTLGDIKETKGTTVKTFIDNEFFGFDELTVNESFIGNTENKLHLALVIEGDFEINGVNFKKGESALIPASTGEYKICGNGVVLRYWK